MNSLRHLAITSVAVAALAFDSFSHPVSAQAVNPEQKLVRAVLNRSLSGPHLWGLKPFASKYGFRTEVVDAISNPDQLRHIVNGVEVGSMGYQIAATMSEQNIGNVRIIAGMYVSGQNIIMRKGVELHSWKDLEGKKIGRAPGSFTSVLFSLAAEINNVDLSKINFITVAGAGPGELQALKAGDLDGLALWSPVIDRAVVDGYGYYPSCCDIGSTKEFGAGNQLLGANTEFLKDRKLVVNFLKAYLEAMDYYSKNPDETIKLVAQYTGLNNAILTEAMKHSRWDFRVDVQNAINVAKQGPKFGFTKGDMSGKVAQLFDLSYLAEASGLSIEQLNRSPR